MPTAMPQDPPSGLHPHHCPSSSRPSPLRSHIEMGARPAWSWCVSSSPSPSSGAPFHWGAFQRGCWGDAMSGLPLGQHSHLEAWCLALCSCAHAIPRGKAESLGSFWKSPPRQARPLAPGSLAPVSITGKSGMGQGSPSVLTHVPALDFRGRRPGRGDLPPIPLARGFLVVEWAGHVQGTGPPRFPLPSTPPSRRPRCMPPTGPLTGSDLCPLPGERARPCPPPLLAKPCAAVPCGSSVPAAPLLSPIALQDRHPESQEWGRACGPVAGALGRSCPRPRVWSPVPRTRPRVRP